MRRKTAFGLGLSILPLLGIGPFSPPAYAQGGMISACPATVNAPGVWKVTGNLTATAQCITIAASGAAIDLGGYTITGLNKGGSTWGVGEEGAGRFSSIIIANGTIKNFEYGVLLETTTNATIAKINPDADSRIGASSANAKPAFYPLCRCAP